MKKRIIELAGVLVITAALVAVGVVQGINKQATQDEVQVVALLTNGNTTDYADIDDTVEESIDELSVEALSIEETAEEEMPTEERSGQNVEENSTCSAELIDFESDNEYSNLAIADVHNYVNVRSLPSTDGEIVGKMYDGSVAQVQEVVGEAGEEWFKVVSGKVEGYIKAEYFIYGDAAVEVIDDYIIRYAKVVADRLNVRQEPDINAKKIGYIDFEETAKILELGDEWTKVQYTESKVGYVSTQYITVEEEFIYAKSIEEERLNWHCRRHWQPEMLLHLRITTRSQYFR